MIFKSKKLYFYEDDYCQIEILPKENLSYLEEENRKITDFANKNRVEFGYSEIYLRKDNQVTLSQKKIKMVDLDKLALTLKFPKIEKIYTGYGSYKERAINTIAYTKDSLEIYCDFNKDIIQNIWIDYINIELSGIEILNKMGKKWNLILNDWKMSYIVDLSNIEDIKSYYKLF